MSKKKATKTPTATLPSPVRHHTEQDVLEESKNYCQDKTHLGVIAQGYHQSR